MTDPDLAAPDSAADFVPADWWAYVRLSAGDREQRLRAADFGSAAAHVQDTVMAGGPRALALVLTLLAARPQDGDLAVLAAGPLEDLVHEHGAALAAELTLTARQNPAFAEALRGVYAPVHPPPGLAPWLTPADRTGLEHR